MKNHQKEYTIKELNIFIENVFEIAFGDDAINKDYTMIEVVDKLIDFSNNAYEYEQLQD